MGVSLFNPEAKGTPAIRYEWRGTHEFSSESVPSILIRVIVFVHHVFRRTMVEIPARHRFGTYALIFALLAIAFSGLSKGAVWATSEVELSTIIQDDFGDDVQIDVTIEDN